MAISTNNHAAKVYMTFKLYAWQCLKRHAACLNHAPILETYIGGTKKAFSDNSQGGHISLDGFQKYHSLRKTYCESRDYQQQYVIKDKNSR